MLRRKGPVALLAALASLAGCFPDARALDEDERLEALALALSYEDAYDARLEARAWDCLYGVRMVVDTGARDAFCPAHARACYLGEARVERRAGVMIFADELEALSAPHAGELVRHELLHRLLECVEGDGDGAHLHPAWAGGASVPAPETSLVARAAGYFE